MSGTLTFLFSDIEGSTQRWERDPGAMAAALARHNELLRSAIETHGGHVFKVIGDAFCAAFAAAPDATAAALGAQRALLAEDFSAVDGLRVRIALHTGHAEEREGDYLGPTLNRVARLVTIGHGGQILISSTTAKLLQEATPDGSVLRDLGAHRLKDLTRPERVYQLAAPDLLDTFPPLRSLDYLPNNLPQQLTSFVGRAGIIADIKTLLDEHRLVTLVGTGGAGKTRCAIQAGADLIDRFADGVWIVELAPILDPALVTATIAQVLGVRQAGSEDLLKTLVTHLEQRQLTLILDNCEHLIDEVRRVAAAGVRASPGVRILATSREPLKIAGEHVVYVPSLEVQDAVQLFADRARAADSRFELTGENEPFVAEICRRLDGIPLAVELAAARVNLLSPRQLTQKLNERFRLLTGGDKSELPRHQTLRATIDWSFDLLDERARAIFRKLSIFVGGWTLEAAVEICGDESDEWEVMESLGSLVDKSLVVVESAGEERRYDMLSTIREYARERLVQADEFEATAARHARFYAAFVRDLTPLSADLEDAEWRRLLGSELDNIRAAIDWTVVQKRDPSVGLELLAGVEWPELVVTPDEALRWYESALALEDAMPSDLVRARLLRHSVVLEWLTGRSTAHREELALRAIEAARRADDPDETARALGYLGSVYLHAARFDEAERAFAQAYATPERLSRLTNNTVLRMWAVSSLQRGDVEIARRRFSEVARLERPGSEAHASALLNLGELEYASGDVEAARNAARKAQEAFAGTNSIYTAIALSNLAAYAMEAGDLDEARAHLRRALQLQREAGERWLASLIQHHALLAALWRDSERAAPLAGFSDGLYAASGEVRQYTERRGYERLMATLAEICSAEEIAAGIELGGRFTKKEALACAAAIYEQHVRQ
ncbi:MAG TPA: adenylate/guanylate cyclase domain-containing protein [Candidatus Babeliales bacterium]|nr:adenylate/guanylate cyclase domain-containing protein [Candidatus Babeliales bacterium]